MAYKGTLIKPDHVPLTWWEDPTTTDADREDAIDEAYNMKLHAEYIAAADEEKKNLRLDGSGARFDELTGEEQLEFERLLADHKKNWKKK